MTLQGFLADSARHFPDDPAVREATGASITYAELERLSDRLRDRLVGSGVRAGDRVGIYMHKSADAIASIFGILKAGAAYVPVDPTAPPTRNAFIHSDCGVKYVIVENCYETAYLAELQKVSFHPAVLGVGGTGGGKGLRGALHRLDESSPAPVAQTVESSPEDLAYILYTSGSTGRPKGVMLSQLNAIDFVNWCSTAWGPLQSDRFSSHAPLHFDLSILDIYVCVKHGGTLVLVPENTGKEPAALAKLIADNRISVWYSAPSILSLLAQSGQLPNHDYSTLRTVLFAGEVFPIVHLRSLKKQWPHPRYFNLYGPTETNVCNYYEIPAAIADDRTEPFPIGRVCENLRGKVVDPDGKDLPRFAEGELCITGPNVMQGYWNQPEQTAKGFLTDPEGTRWYRTGDIVVEDPDGNFVYRGRRDRMIKKRGYRVELGEIEVCLYRHPGVREAAVVALPDDQAGYKVIAHLAPRAQVKLSIIDLKRFCSEHLPVYMVPDLFAFHESLPKTSTDKTDYQILKERR